MTMAMMMTTAMTMRTTTASDDYNDNYSDSDDDDDDDDDDVVELTGGEGLFERLARRKASAPSASASASIPASASASAPASASASAARKAPVRQPDEQADFGVTILVDERERVTNKRPLGIYLDLVDLVGALGGGGESYAAERRDLHLGDFAWVRGGALVDGVVERKRIGDLVARSAQGDHVEQLRRMAISSCHSRCFLLLEGDPEVAAGYTPYGADGYLVRITKDDRWPGGKGLLGMYSYVVSPYGGIDLWLTTQNE